MKSNSRMNVAVIWWEAVNMASNELQPIRAALKYGKRGELLGSLRVIAGCYETWMGCQDRWRQSRGFSEEAEQIADAYLAMEFDIGALYELIQRIEGKYLTYKEEVRQVMEVVKVASSMPLFAKA